MSIQIWARHWLDYERYKAIWLRNETELEHIRNVDEGRISRPVAGGWRRALKEQLEEEGV